MTSEYSGCVAERTEIETGVFGPEDLAVLRASLDQAREALPPESRTTESMQSLAAAIVRVATHGERDPVRLSELALKAITPGATHGAV